MQRDVPDPELQARELPPGVVPEALKPPSRGAKNATVLLPHYQCSAVEQRGVTESADTPSSIAERPAQQAKRQGLVTQVGCFLRNDAPTDRAEQLRARGVTKRLVVGHRQNLRGDQHHRADLQPGQLAQPPKDSIEPVLLPPWKALAVQEAPEDVTVGLLLGDEKLQGGQK